MTGVDDGGARASAGLPSAAALAAERAGLPDPGRAFVVGFGAGDGAAGEGAGIGDALSGLPAAWAERRHLIVRSGPRLSTSDAARCLRDAGVSAETPALVASGLGTGRERLLYGSLDDAHHPGFGAGAVLLVPHPAALTVDFAWPPTAAPEVGRRDPP